MLNSYTAACRRNDYSLFHYGPLLHRDPPPGCHSSPCIVHFIEAASAYTPHDAAPTQVLNSYTAACRRNDYSLFHYGFLQHRDPHPRLCALDTLDGTLYLPASLEEDRDYGARQQYLLSMMSGAPNEAGTLGVHHRSSHSKCWGSWLWLSLHFAASVNGEKRACAEPRVC